MSRAKTQHAVAAGGAHIASPPAVRERPILFQGWLVRAIIAGQKTVTRRPVKPQPIRDAYNANEGDYVIWDRSVQRFRQTGPRAGVTDPVPCPYGAPGDRLWVRETWGHGCRPDPFDGWIDGIEYRADCADLEEHDSLPLYQVTPPDDFEWDDVPLGWRPSIFMPRWACRLVLDVVEVSVERLQQLTIAEAIAEGLPQTGGEAHAAGFIDLAKTPGHEWDNRTSVENFRHGWDGLYRAKPELRWDSNPWVWRVAFRRLTP